jgi:hypothetical protein
MSKRVPVYRVTVRGCLQAFSNAAVILEEMRLCPINAHG